MDTIRIFVGVKTYFSLKNSENYFYTIIIQEYMTSVTLGVHRNTRTHRGDRMGSC